ncbi:MAG TPA: hypothetical protein VFH80_09510 [Solirubrobacteraceae bacterium]|nr:hypothetical protein [Solirubrobacteraceae bacterium]
MDTARDLACPALWQESLERSLARRGRPTRSSLELSHLRVERDLSRPELLHESLMYSQLRRSAVSRRPSMAVPGAGGISALALLAATTLPGLLGGGRADGHRVVGYRADTSDARLANSPVAGLAADPNLAAKATAATEAAPVTAATAPAEPSHVLATRTVTAPHKSAPSASATRRAPRHPQLAHIAADHGASKPVAHALSGGAAPAAPKLVAAAPRVPAEPQPIGHPRTGGGAIEAASHTQTPAHTPQAPSHSVGTASPSHSVGTASPTHSVGAPSPTHSVGAASPTHPVGSASPTHSGGAATPAGSQPVAAGRPKPVTTTHPVSPAKLAPTTPPPAAPGRYVNPLADANLTPERIDQGVDYSGSGTLGAIGNGKVTYVGTSGTGWPGAFIEYQLTDGVYAGRYVFYAESISPASGLHVGQTVRAGQPIASIHGGIEIGWASGVGTQPAAQADGQWGGGSDANNKATADGKSFSALIAQLGGPPGKVEG